MSDRRTKSKLPAWHAGEKAIQQRAGVAERMEAVGQRAVRDFMPDQHRDFFAQIPFIVVGSVDQSGDAWASLLTGRPGFIASPTPRSLEIDARPDAGDPVSDGMREDDAIALLGIELHTRRRNRANGLLRASPGKALSFELDQSFGNCPQYIQLRDFNFVREPDQPFTGEIETSTTLDQAAREMIAAAD
ncbi:MAG: pyridoxamine 5'-phosphate oxidase family protein, partial [Bradyrhizobium sp.]